MPLTHAKPSKLDMTAHFNVGSADPQTAAVRSNVALLSHQTNILNMTWQRNHIRIICLPRLGALRLAH